MTLPIHACYNRRMDWLDFVINFSIVIVLLLSLSFSDARLDTINDRVNILAVDYSFDFNSWTLDAIRIKIGQSAIGAPRYFSAFDQHQIVVQYLQLVASIENTQNRIDVIYSDPSVKDPAQASADLRQQLAEYTDRQNFLAPFAESVLQQQVAQILDEKRLTLGGQPIPWVLYHVTPLPQDLIISSRSKIEQETSYQLEPDLTVAQAANLESSVDKKLGVSSLVVDIGGLATYPTMIMRTTALDWLSSTIAHEWTHLYLGQRPLGMNYESSPELRTMNETTASIAGDEIGRIVIQRYYPELAQDAAPAPQLVSHLIGATAPDAPPFDFRAEMHETRVQADALLAEGKIDAAEAYMEQRRQVFWDHGYPIRKLNQAYFAFYGAYADVPGGPAGEDPVGPAVRALRKQSASLTAFLERISQMSTFAELQQAVGSSAAFSPADLRAGY
ncbi:MAG: hypothetical protein WA821_05195 [Anaerolineales bacterium]